MKSKTKAEECNCDQALELKRQLQINSARWARECDKLTKQLEACKKDIDYYVDLISSLVRG